jgi:microcompartment protein CcmK/EutM
MLIARVVGTVISTIKDEKVKGTKLLILKPTDQAGNIIGEPFVATDLVDAGEGELVLTGHGSSARQTSLTKDCPVDAVIMAVIDHLEVDGEVVFRKE